MKAFQCSRCSQLDQDDIDDKVFCKCGINPLPQSRDKSDREECLKCFIELPREKHWHEKFHWE